MGAREPREASQPNQEVAADGGGRTPSTAGQLTLAELSERTGTAPAQLDGWAATGFIGGNRGERAFTLADLERIRLLEACSRLGVARETLIRLEENDPGLFEDCAETLYPRGLQPTRPVAAAALASGIDEQLAERILLAGGLHDVRAGLDARDEAFLSGCRMMLDAGLPEEALLQVLRVYADALDRVAEAESRVFHFYIHDRLRQSGLAGRELAERRLQARRLLQPALEPTIEYFHRRGLMKAVRHDLLLHLGVEARSDDARATGELDLATVFVDLASFTSLADAMGDEVAAGVVQRFSGLVRDTVARTEGRTVKQIGDGFMIVFAEPCFALAAAFEIKRRAHAEREFPAVRIGIHYGSALYRDGDYVGASVNLASRVAAEAAPHEILVTRAVRDGLHQFEDAEFVPVGARRLKGLPDELELFDARELRGEWVAKEPDPVCGMELAPSEAAASLSLDGRRFAFCSEGCLQRFVEARDVDAGRARPAPRRVRRRRVT